MPPKKIALPPKPLPKKPAASVQELPKKKPDDLRGIKAVKYRIDLEDGSYLEAVGEHADLIFRYLNACEVHAAQSQAVNYLAPSLTRYDAQGKFLAQGADLSASVGR